MLLVWGEVEVVVPELAISDVEYVFATASLVEREGTEMDKTEASRIEVTRETARSLEAMEVAVTGMAVVEGMGVAEASAGKGAA